MCVITQKGGGGAQMCQQPPGSAGILGGNDGDRPEHLGGAGGQVPEIAERSGDDEKGSRVDLSSDAA